MIIIWMVPKAAQDQEFRIYWLYRLQTCTAKVVKAKMEQF